MGLTNVGRDFLAGAAVGAESTLFNATNARIGVGNGTTVFSVSQTDLQGSSKFRKGMDSGYPKRNGNVLTFKSTFGPNEANFAWEEWGVFNAATGGVMLNRLVEYNGTKQSGQTWIFEVELTINIGS